MLKSLKTVFARQASAERSGQGAQSRALRVATIVAIVLIGLGALALLYLFEEGRGTPMWARWVLSAVIVIVAWFSFTTLTPPPQEMSVADFAVTQAGLNVIGLSIITGWLAAIGVTAIIEPQDASVLDVQADGELTREVIRQASGLSEEEQLQKLTGVWGETIDCKVAYDYELDDDYLIVTRIRGDGLSDFRMEASFEGERDGKLGFRVEVPRDTGGSDFLQLRRTGEKAAERLEWIEGRRDVATVFVRCEG